LNLNPSLNPENNEPKKNPGKSKVRTEQINNQSYIPLLKAQSHNVTKKASSQNTVNPDEKEERKRKNQISVISQVYTWVR
jgi:hypothetical protein